MTRSWIVGVVAVAACGGHRVSVAPSPSPETAVQEFMAAAADNDVPRMAQFWGNAKGAAAETGQPEDYPKRMDIVLAYLRGTGYQILGRTNSLSVSAREAQGLDTLRVRVSLQQCSKDLPFAMVRTPSQRWVIQAFDLAAVGQLQKPCASGGR